MTTMSLKWNLAPGSIACALMLSISALGCEGGDAGSPGDGKADFGTFEVPLSVEPGEIVRFKFDSDSAFVARVLQPTAVTQVDLTVLGPDGEMRDAGQEPVVRVQPKSS
jgi:hypothetical protein